MAAIFNRVSGLGQALDFHLERHNLLAANIAHIDTPNYKPNDLARVEPSGSFNEVFQVSLQRTDPAHLRGMTGANEQGRVFQDLSAGGGADGNYVSLDREAAKLAANQLRYDMVSVLVSSELSGLMRASGDMKG